MQVRIQIKNGRILNKVKLIARMQRLDPGLTKVVARQKLRRLQAFLKTKTKKTTKKTTKKKTKKTKKKTKKTKRRRPTRRL